MAIAADKGAQISLVGGLSVIDAENTGAFKLAGIKGSAFIANSVTIGGYYLGSDSSGERSSDDKFTYSMLGVETGYHMGASNGDAFVALRVGLSKVVNSPAGTPITFSPYHYGLVAGYDYGIAKNFAIGFEGSFLRVLNGRTSLTGVTYERDPFNVISFLLTLQFKM